MDVSILVFFLLFLTVHSEIIEISRDTVLDINISNPNWNHMDHVWHPSLFGIQSALKNTKNRKYNTLSFFFDSLYGFEVISWLKISVVFDKRVSYGRVCWGIWCATLIQLIISVWGKNPILYIWSLCFLIVIFFLLWLKIYWTNNFDISHKLPSGIQPLQYKSCIQSGYKVGTIPPKGGKIGWVNPGTPPPP